MKPRTIYLLLGVCISIVVISVVVRLQLYVLQSLLPLYEAGLSSL